MEKQKEYYYAEDDPGLIWGIGHTEDEAKLDGLSQHKLHSEESSDEYISPNMKPVICTKQDYEYIGAYDGTELVDYLLPSYG